MSGNRRAAHPKSYGQYQPPTGYQQSQARSRNGFGIAALLMGLLALVLSWTIIGGIVWVYSG